MGMSTVVSLNLVRNAQSVAANTVKTWLDTEWKLRLDTSIGRV